MQTYLKIYADRLSGAESQPIPSTVVFHCPPLILLHYTLTSPAIPAISAFFPSAAILAASISAS
jgi:hypothetical protein